MDAGQTSGLRQGLRQRWQAGERLVGTFVKTTSHQVIEVLAHSGLDFVVLDAEHAPFDRGSLDTCLLAARASGLAALVRVPDVAAVLAALDVGAEGVLVPHVADADRAARVVAAGRYRGGSRGFSSSHRAGSYGCADPVQYLREADERTVLIAQIEDREALECVEGLMAVPGIDGFFIGRADLMVSMGAAGPHAPEVEQAVARIAAAARRAGQRFGLFVPAFVPEEIARFAGLGASLFVIGSDQSLMRAAASAVARSFHIEGTDHAG